MPKAQVSKIIKREDFVYTPVLSKKSGGAPEGRECRRSGTRVQSVITPREDVGGDGTEMVDMAKNHVYFPRDVSQRENYRTKAGKKVTQYQWDVYDFILKIPMGRVTTYKAISESVGGSSRSVGGALKINPFSPYIPCHRVVASNHFIGGFFGQWAGRDSQGSVKERQKEGSQLEIQRKIALLKEEDVEVDGRGFLVGGGSLVWGPT